MQSQFAPGERPRPRGEIVDAGDNANTVASVDVRCKMAAVSIGGELELAGFDGRLLQMKLLQYGILDRANEGVIPALEWSEPCMVETVSTVDINSHKSRLAVADCRRLEMALARTYIFEQLCDPAGSKNFAKQEMRASRICRDSRTNVDHGVYAQPTDAKI